MKELNRTNRLTIGALVFIFLLIIAYLFVKSPDHKYQIDVESANEAILMFEDEIFPEDVASIIEYGDSGYYFIDVRYSDDFAKGHIETADNIPLPLLLEKENIDLLNQLAKDSVTVIMYGQTQNDANGAWMLLKQMGYNNIKVMLGGYHYYTTGPLDLYDMPDIPEYLVEDPLYDYAAVIEEIGGPVTPGMDADESPETIVPVRKKKKAVVEGGC